MERNERPRSVSRGCSTSSEWGPRASPPYHSRITHSRHRTALGGHQRTPAWSTSYSRGPCGSLSDTGGHGIDTVRDREAEGSNPSPPTRIRIQIGHSCPRQYDDAAVICSSSALSSGPVSLLGSTLGGLRGSPSHRSSSKAVWWPASAGAGSAPALSRRGPAIGEWSSSAARSSARALARAT